MNSVLVGMKVSVSDKESPIYGKEFKVRKVYNESKEADLEDSRGNEITLPFASLAGDDLYTPEVLFEFDNTLVDDKLVPNYSVIRQFKLLWERYSVGILTYRIMDGTSDKVDSFVSEHLKGRNVPIVSFAGPGTKMIVSSRVTRVDKDSGDICPMCIVSNKYFTYKADINQSMILNTGSIQR